MDLTIQIERDAVMNTVTHSAAYTGSKYVGDDNAYTRIHTSDLDRDKLLQMWEESAADLAEKFHGVLKSQGLLPVIQGTTQETWQLILEVPSNFEQASADGILKNLTSFFCNSILGKWFVYTNKEEAGAYADHAQTFLNAAHALLHERMKPTRPTIVDTDELNQD